MVLRSSFNLPLKALSFLLLTSNPSSILLVDAQVESCTNVMNEFGNVTYGDVVNGDTCEEACKLILGEDPNCASEGEVCRYPFTTVVTVDTNETFCGCRDTSGPKKLCSDVSDPIPLISRGTCTEADIADGDDCSGACRELFFSGGIFVNNGGRKSCACGGDDISSDNYFCIDDEQQTPDVTPAPAPTSGAPQGTTIISAVFSVLFWSYF